jgi:copper chaperone CopZ
VSQQHLGRRRVVAACLFVVPILLASCASTPNTASDDRGDSIAERPAPTDDSVVLVAHGMACPKCVTNADLQLMKLEGVRSVAIDMKHGFITVAIDPADRPSHEDYARAIDAAGLTLVSVHEAPAEASAP